ncbi:MAG: 16S rRNA (guanine(527)-N(7))-methyltransferase RsmG [Deltaproteobacteria bacterium]|nr:16S rRNA (guanine(527)-N(7))-methyltransferase RsmG [Deltaproteobacteria bacterium]MBW2070871.1 16S rRNA (guanine(527)-N(7))-methyltransferase RsmG [Deltaproteobacteria bacterium]
MDKKSLLHLLRRSCDQIGVELIPDQAEQFWLYLQELLEWNQKFNLTGITQPEEILIKHFVDSLTPLPYLAGAKGLLDIGTGAGFPGIPLKIAAPFMQVHLVDSRRKKITFVQHIIRSLNLQKILVSHGRIEEMPEVVPRYQIVISRAFQQPEQLFHLLSGLLAPQSVLVVMLGPTNSGDRSRLQKLGAASRLVLSRVVCLQLPHRSGARTLLFFNKRY